MDYQSDLHDAKPEGLQSGFAQDLAERNVIFSFSVKCINNNIFNYCKVIIVTVILKIKTLGYFRVNYEKENWNAHWF